LIKKFKLILKKLKNFCKIFTTFAFSQLFPSTNYFSKKQSLELYRLQIYNTFFFNFKHFDERTKIGDERSRIKTRVTLYGRMIAPFLPQKMILTNGKKEG